MRRFTSMTLPVADFLIENMLLHPCTDDEFGIWVRDLPPHGGIAIGDAYIVPRFLYGVHSYWSSLQPRLRQPSIAGGPPLALYSLTRHASMGPVVNHDYPDSAVLPALELDNDEEEEQQRRQEQEQEQPQQIKQPEQHEAEVGRSASPSLRSSSNTKSRKCGHKCKGVTPSVDYIQTSKLAASVSQTLSRESSRSTRSASASIDHYLMYHPLHLFRCLYQSGAHLPSLYRHNHSQPLPLDVTFLASRDAYTGMGCG